MLSTRLVLAYRRSPYQVGAVRFRVGRRSAVLDGILRRWGIREAVLITAWNPGSRRMPPAWNRRMQRRLEHRLRLSTLLPARSGDGHWAEAQILAVMDPRRAAVLGRLYRQSAIVLLRRGTAPRLGLL